MQPGQDFGNRNAYTNGGFLGISVILTSRCLCKLWFPWLFLLLCKKMLIKTVVLLVILYFNKEVLIKTVVLLVFVSPVSLRHSCKAFGENKVAEESRRFTGESKNNKIIVCLSIPLLRAKNNNRDNHSFYKHLLTQNRMAKETIAFIRIHPVLAALPPPVVVPYSILIQS